MKTKEDWLMIYNSKNGEEIAKQLGDDGSMWKNREFIKSLCGRTI